MNVPQDSHVMENIAILSAPDGLRRLQRVIGCVGRRIAKGSRVSLRQKRRSPGRRVS